MKTPDTFPASPKLSIDQASLDVDPVRVATLFNQPDFIKLREYEEIVRTGINKKNVEIFQELVIKYRAALTILGYTEEEVNAAIEIYRNSLAEPEQSE